MLYAADLPGLRSRIAETADLTALLSRLGERATPVLERMPVIPELKALLSMDGGVCPADGAPLRFDPWSPDRHRCTTCGAVATGERHDRHWARTQHLWVAERAAHLATVGVLAENDAAIARAREILLAYPELYFSLPNQDNVLGPSRLFFSTYLESLWLTNYLAAAMLLREGGALDSREADRIGAVAEEASAMIGEFNEGMSNRQTWHSAALTAIAVWFEDEELATVSIQSPTGLLGHLTDGFGGDGLWFEGENYHLFALRGLLMGLGWARAAGTDLLADPALAQLLGAALLAPAGTALPDLTFPARKDARYGVSLAQPAHLEVWETGHAWVSDARDELTAWLAALYAAPSPEAQAYDAYLHEVGETPPPRRTRADLSWWALLTMDPALDPPAEPWRPASRLFESSGLAILRQGDRYTSLECASTDLGHGHPDRLHLTVHAGGVHWLPDPGAGSYVSRDLFWYRSTLAHNAPLLDGRSQGGGESSAWCEAFDTVDGHASGLGWARGRWGPVTRTLVTGPTWIADLVAFQGGEKERELSVPWHLQGETKVTTPGQWEPADLHDEFARDAERFAPVEGGLVSIEAIDPSGASLVLHLLLDDADLIRVTGPGIPGTGDTSFFLVRSARAGAARQAAVLDLAAAADPARITGMRLVGEVIVIGHASGDDTTVELAPGRVDVMSPPHQATLTGARSEPKKVTPLFKTRKAWDVVSSALAPTQPPALDGTLDGFDLDAPLTLDDEHQYRRSEDPYEGSGQFSATAWVNWDFDALYLAVDVAKPEVVIRAADAEPLRLDNEPDDIHADGIQVYFRVADEAGVGLLIVPTDAGRIRAHGVEGTAGAGDMVDGGWRLLDPDEDGLAGYRLTVRIACPALANLPPRSAIDFDLLVNEMRPDRERRTGQLVWSGGEGWIYLRGDRHGGEYGRLALM